MHDRVHKGLIEVTYRDHMGSDLSVVNAARVSMSKESEWADDGVLKSNDEGLIRFLARSRPVHWSPFAHPQVSVHVKAPIFVARQMVKHQVGLVWNEVSRRYVDDPPEYFIPQEWRLRAEHVKQGSSETEHAETFDVDSVILASFDGHKFEDSSVDAVVSGFYALADELYRSLLHRGVAPELARVVLPVGSYTEWVWTGSLYAWARVAWHRKDSHAQREARDFVEPLDAIMRRLFPVSWPALMDEARD